MLHHRCTTGFCICLRFWICQRSEYSGVLNEAGLWISLGSEYASASASEYVRAMDIPQF